MKDEWKTVALDEVATIERSAIQPEAIEQGTAYLGLEHIESGGKILGAKPVDEGELASSKFHFTPRHVLYGKLRPYLAKIACPDFTGICSTDILPILPGPDLERRFLCYFLRQPSMVDYANSRAAGANLPRLSPSALAGFEIPLPPLAEQRRIAEVLDRAEALRAKRRAALAQLDTLTQSILTELLRDCRELKTKSLEQIAMDMHQGINTVTEKIEYQTAGYPIIQSKHVTQGYLDLSDARFVNEATFAKYKNKYSPAKNDLLLCNIGTIGNSLLMEENIDFLIAWNLFLIKLDEQQVSPCYCKHYFDHLAGRHYFDQFLTGGTVKFISKKTLGATPIPLPPIPLQREFARRVSAVEKLKAAQRASLAELDALFATLQHRAFRGEL